MFVGEGEHVPLLLCHLVLSNFIKFNLNIGNYTWLAAKALIRPLAWEPPYAMGAALEKIINK